MVWFTKACVTLSLILVASTAWADRVYFDNQQSTQASLETYAVALDRGLPAIEVRLTVPGVDIGAAQDGFDQLSAQGLFSINKPGKPDLLATGTLIAVPDGFEPRIARVTKKERQIENVLIEPAQRKFRCAPYSDGFEFDSGLYQSDSWFPSQLIQLEEVGRLQSVRLMRVAIHPFQLNPAARSLRITHDLTAIVTLEQTSRTVRSAQLPKSLYQIVRSVTSNGQYLGSLVEPSAAAELLMIFVGDSLKDSIKPLVAWKQAKGLAVKVVTLTEAGGTKESLQKYIQNYYDTQAVKPTYLLFVGNKDTMPPFFEETGSGSAASDYRFALLTGGDAIPDVLYGRVVADNAGEVEKQISRWMEYEKSPPKGDWFPKGLTIASSEGSNPSDKEYAEMVATALKGYTYKQIDAFTQGAGNATPANITKALNEGRTWLSYFGHGSGTSWGSTNGSFSNSTITSSVKNDAKLPVIIDVACENANWADWIQPCFGKVWVTHANNGMNAGAVAFYGGSVSISWHPPAVMSVGVAKYHFEKPVYTLGGSVQAGQMYLVEKMGTGNDVIDNIKWYNLFGDPSMLVRTDVPKAYSIKQQIKKDVNGIIVEIKATASEGTGMKGLVASLSSAGGNTLAVGTTDDKGEVALTVSGITQLEPNTLLTTTGYNAETQQVVVQ